MEIVVAALLGGIFGALLGISLTLESISKTLKSNDESLSKIAKHFEQMDKENENNKHSSGSLT